MPWKPTEGIKPSAVLDSAVEDSREHRYEDALHKFLWFHEASRAECGLGGVRLSFALGYWMDLASEFPPALEAFIKLRDDMENRCRDCQGDFESFHDVCALNRCLGQDRRTIDLFMDIARDFPENARLIYHVVERCLVAAGMYQQCGPFLDWENRVTTSISAYEIGLKHEASRTDKSLCPPEYARCHFQAQAATIVALLALNNRPEEAHVARDQCLAVLDDDEFRAVLDTALTGHFPEDDAGGTQR